MPAPTKAGLDYFPFDVGLIKDKKLRRPKLKYGYLATQVYIALLTLLYNDKGYYIPYGTQNERDDCIWYVLDCLQGKYQPDANTIAEIIDELVACELFSGDHYPKNITSKHSQIVYYSATVERKSVVINADIWLLSLDEMKTLSEKHSYYRLIQDRTKNEVNQPINEVNQPIYSQSKVNKSKEKDISHSAAVVPEGDADGDEEPSPIQLFCNEYGVQMDGISGVISDIDFTVMSQKYAESEWLRTTPCALTMSWVCRNYRSILADKYKDRPKTVTGKGGGSQGVSMNAKKRIHDLYKNQEIGDGDNDTN